MIEIRYLFLACEESKRIIVLVNTAFVIIILICVFVNFFLRICQTVSFYEKVWIKFFLFFLKCLYGLNILIFDFGMA